MSEHLEMLRWREVAPGRFAVEADSVDSTQDLARRLLDSSESVVSVRALHQTAGRGRGGARWIDAPGQALLATCILRDSRLAGERLAGLAFAAALAVAQAVEALAGIRLEFKWPNDLLLGGRKAGGILIEAVPRAGGTAALVGVGLNVHAPPADEEGNLEAACLAQAASGGFDLHRLHDQIWERLEVQARRLAEEGAGPILADWRARDATGGRRYRLLLDGQPQEGEAVGVDDDGALRVRLADGRIVSARAATAAPDPDRPRLDRELAAGRARMDAEG